MRIQYASLVFLVLASATAPDSAVSVPAERTEVRFEMASPEQLVTFTCGSCGNNGSQHSFVIGTTPYNCEASETGCHAEYINGTCADWHQDCFALSAALAATRRSLADGDYGELKQLVESGRAIFNADRQVLQIEGCDDLIAAQVALPAEATALLRVQ